MKSPQRLILEACLPKGMTIQREHPMDYGADYQPSLRNFLLGFGEMVLDVQFAGAEVSLGRRDRSFEHWVDLNDPEALEQIRGKLCLYIVGSMCPC